MDIGMDQAPPAALAVRAAQREEISSDQLVRQLRLPQESGTAGRRIVL